MTLVHLGKLAMFALTVAASASGVVVLAHSAPGDDPPPDRPAVVADKEKGKAPDAEAPPLRIAYTERGSLEAGTTRDIFSQVEGQATIISLVPEGKKVRKGDPVCEFDSSTLRDQLTNQIITKKGAEAAFQKALLERERGEIAITEYMEGVGKADRDQLAGEAATRRAAVDEARSRIARTEGILKAVKGLTPMSRADYLAELTTQDRLEAARLDLVRETAALEQAETRLKVLEKYTAPMTVTRLKADLQGHRTVELSKRSTWELEQTKEARLKLQIANCKMFAPADGLVVLANDPRRTSGGPLIESNATVRERQKILSIVDLDQPMQVNVKLPEATVDRFAPRQKAIVTVDAFPGETFTGTVLDVAPLPDPYAMATWSQKVYTSHIKLDKASPSLRPGMTATAEIEIAGPKGALVVPPDAISANDRENRLNVRDREGQVVARVVKVEATEDGGLEVKSGLEPGDVVILPSFRPFTRQNLAEREAADRNASLMISIQGKLSRLPDDVRPVVREVVTKGGDAEAQLKAKGFVEIPTILKNAGFTDAELGVVIPGHGKAGREGSERTGFDRNGALRLSILSKLSRLPADLFRAVDHALKVSFDAEPQLLAMGIVDIRSTLQEAGFTDEEIELVIGSFKPSRRGGPLVSEPIKSMSEKVSKLPSELRSELRKAGMSMPDRVAILKKSGVFTSDEIRVIDAIAVSAERTRDLKFRP